MRRRDFITLGLLAVVVAGSLYKLQSPVVVDGSLSLDDRFLAQFSPWTGPIERAQAQGVISDGSGQVKGATSDSSFEPKSLLPVESYSGSPLLDSVEAMLAAHNVMINPEDIISAFPNPNLRLGSVIKVYRATPVTLTDWGKDKSFRTWATTVQQFVDEQNLEIGDNDTVEPKLSSNLALDATVGAAVIKVTRVEITEIKEKEKIDFKKISKEDPNLAYGEKKVTKGVLGERVRIYQVRREDGKEVSRKLLKNEVTKEPSDETTIIGTKLIVGETYSGPISWYKYDSTKVATDHFKRNVILRVTNLDTGKVIIVKNDGCICSDTQYIVDLHPDLFKMLGGKLGDGVMKHGKIEEIKSPIEAVNR